MKALIFLVFAWSFIYANTMVHFDKGWKLVGVLSSMDTMKNFDNSHVELMWGFNADEQKWEGYSPDSAISKKISDNNISTLGSLQPYQAVWILSKEAWSLEIVNSTPQSEPANDSIVLKKGWNLVTIPNKTIVWKNFFGDAVVWKYDEAWIVNDASLNFPTITNIKESEGIWVNSKEETSISMGNQLSKLTTFDSSEEMLSYLREMKKSNYYRYSFMPVHDTNNTDIALPTADASANENPKVADATSTNLQESGVDESDILKHDGKYIFSLDSINKQIFITSFENIALKNYKALNTISTTEKGSIVSMYLQNNRLILISSDTNFLFVVGGADDGTVIKSALYPYSSSANAKVTIYDTTDINNIVELSSHAIDGTYEESRLINGKLFFITKFYPDVQYDYPKIYADTICSKLNLQKIYGACSSTTPVLMGDIAVTNQVESCTYGADYYTYQDNQCYIYNYDSDGRTWKYDYENPIVTSENFTPKIVSNGASSELIEPSKFYVPQKLDQDSAITTISTFDIASAIYKESISFLGNTQTYYASQTSLYLISNEYPLYYNFYDFTERQMIYKFALGDTLSYKGRGFVDGTMLNQFSMSEKDDYLRVATTKGNTWSGAGTENSVFTLKENNETLEVKGTLSGLGKENERIMAVRFMGDRGFVVTFKQTDPLYTLDMSDPLHPKAVGELSIPGFSRYLHVVDENRVLSIGRDANTITGQALGLQLQLFDVTDFTNPLLVDKTTIGGSYTYSSAEYNHKAFVYRPSDLMFGLQYSNLETTGSTNNFGIFQMDGMSIKKVHTMSKALVDYYWGDANRGLIFDLNSTTYGALFEGSNILSDTILNGE
ncbi:MAG: beta-propeller domain-containing protein [Campylobacterales bacterium]|nr:beta-propeller domain-containing protein [Campylobacterales bacterium]